MNITREEARLLARVLEGKPISTFVADEARLLVSLRKRFKDHGKTAAQVTFDEAIENGLPFEEAVARAVQEHGEFYIPENN